MPAPQADTQMESGSGLGAAAAVLSVSGVRYEYHTQPALDDVSFEVRAGELVALIGRNGAGKSTLLRCIAGWARPVDGEIHVLGLPVYGAERAVRSHMVLVPDTPAFYDELTAWEHLQLVAQTHRLIGWADRAQKLLQRFDLWASRGAYPFTHSRGMRYKLAIVMALLVEPRLLLFDEPLGPLDPVSADALWSTLRQYRAKGTAILLSSHQLPPDPQPDCYLVLEQGELVLQGTPAGLRQELGIRGRLSLKSLLRKALPALEESADGA